MCRAGRPRNGSTRAPNGEVTSGEPGSGLASGTRPITRRKLVDAQHAKPAASPRHGRTDVAHRRGSGTKGPPVAGRPAPSRNLSGDRPASSIAPRSRSDSPGPPSLAETRRRPASARSGRAKPRAARCWVCTGADLGSRRRVTWTSRWVGGGANGGLGMRFRLGRRGRGPGSGAKLITPSGNAGAAALNPEQRITGGIDGARWAAARQRRLRRRAGRSPGWPARHLCGPGLEPGLAGQKIARPTARRWPDRPVGGFARVRNSPRKASSLSS